MEYPALQPADPGRLHVVNKMGEFAGGDQPLVTWLFGIAVTLISGAFAFTHVRIGQVRDEGRSDLEQLRAEIMARLEESTKDRLRLWEETRNIQREVATTNREVLEKLGAVPTRQELRSDLAASEQRIQQMITQRVARH